MISILIASLVAIGLALLGTPAIIVYFRERGFGQSIRDDGPETHQVKAGTPTMGGTAIIVAGTIGFAAAHLTEHRFTPAGLLIMFTFVGMGIVGFLDDFIKVRMRRSLGLNKTAKFVGQAVIAAVFASVGPALAGIPRNISVVGDIAITIPAWFYFIWVFLLISGFSNAVNLTDGLDGLAAGSSSLALGAYTLIGFWMFRNSASYVTLGRTEALDVAIISVAVLAACAGFLWFNAPPARIIMGDTGSLALGGLLAALALVTNTQMLLMIIGGLFVIETASVIIQVIAFRGFNTRAFRMAPVHHHFELVGWHETTVVVRFWIIAGLFAAFGLGLFYAEWINRVGVQ